MGTFSFIMTSVLLGVGLAMDAFSVSMANGLNETKMRIRKMCIIAGTFAFFQALMPLLGWLAVHTIIEIFKSFQICIPWIALALLGYIGGKMLYDGFKGEEEEVDTRLDAGTLFVQGIATSIDALSVGFTIANYNFKTAFICCMIIAAVTFVISYVGVIIGKKSGTKLGNKATILGGIILIAIGLEIFIQGVF